jgi:hypothetical protein
MRSVEREDKFRQRSGTNPIPHRRIYSLLLSFIYNDSSKVHSDYPTGAGVCPATPWARLSQLTLYDVTLNAPFHCY